MLRAPPEPIQKAHLPMSNIIAIPLNKLTRSARNVRKSGGDSIDDLATSILVHGLIHNLTVVEQQADNGENAGKYEVVAGGRRFAALQRLAKQKKVPKTFAVPCHVVDLSGAKYGRSTGLSGMSPSIAAERVMNARVNRSLFP